MDNNVNFYDVNEKYAYTYDLFTAQKVYVKAPFCIESYFINIKGHRSRIRNYFYCNPLSVVEYAKKRFFHSEAYEMKLYDKFNNVLLTKSKPYEYKKRKNR